MGAASSRGRPLQGSPPWLLGAARFFVVARRPRRRFGDRICASGMWGVCKAL